MQKNKCHIIENEFPVQIFSSKFWTHKRSLFMNASVYTFMAGEYDKCWVFKKFSVKTSLLLRKVNSSNRLFWLFY